MNILEKAFRALRSWAGLDPVERLTPAHSWLLPSAGDARRQLAVALARRADRRRGRDGRP
jgi:hypothetical protein